RVRQGCRGQGHASDSARRLRRKRGGPQRRLRPDPAKVTGVPSTGSPDLGSECQARLVCRYVVRLGEGLDSRSVALKIMSSSTLSFCKSELLTCNSPSSTARVFSKKATNSSFRRTVAIREKSLIGSAPIFSLSNETSSLTAFSFPASSHGAETTRSHAPWASGLLSSANTV